MLKLFVLCFLCSCTVGFLLDGDNNQNQNDSRYLTMKDLININQNIEKVRNEFQVNISQLKARLALVDEQIAKQNATIDSIEPLEQKVAELEYNNTKLTQSLDGLKKENSDFRARLNNAATKNETYKLDQKLDSVANQSENKLAEYQKLTSEKFSMFESHQNKTNDNFLDQINKNAEKVSLTACHLQTDTVPAKSVIPFVGITTSVGIKNITSFRYSGKFTFDVPGLYHISAVITSYTSGAYYEVYKNGIPISTLYVSEHPTSYIHTSTAVLVLDLQVGDTVWVQTVPSMVVYGSYSCLTIVKVK